MKISILPPNLSDLEKELDKALDRLASIDIPISRLWNPYLCPFEALPYLAWAVSVDQWSSLWPESVKRRVVANSLAVHAKKGTRPAVEQALSSLGVTAEFKEWFEATPHAQRGTFELTAWVNENLTPDQVGFLNEQLYEQLKREVDNAKNARSHYTFKVGAKFGPDLIGAACTAYSAGLMRCDGIAKQDPLASVSGAGVALAGNVTSLFREEMTVVSDAFPRATGVALGASIHSASIIYRRMEATT